MSRKRTLPVARPAKEFVIEVLADEVLVYDQVSHQAHCLSAAAARVWNLCDGKTAYAAAQQALAGTADTVDGVVDQLTRAGLVHAAVERRRTSQSRRAMLRKTAVVAGVVLASPVIFSIVAPSVAEAASTACGGSKQPCCQTPPPCASGKCLSGVCP